MTLDDAITEVRRLLQDETATYRYSDAFLFGLGNQVLNRIQLLRPDLFATEGTVTCTQSATLQSAPSDSLRLIEVLYISGGNNLIEVNREILDQTMPTWRTDTEAAAQNWMRHIRNPNKFFIYPQAPAAQDIVVEYSKIPAAYATGEAIALLPAAYLPAIIDGMVYLAESADNEHVNSGRAKMFKDSFSELLGVSQASWAVTDTEDAGLSARRLKVI